MNSSFIIQPENLDTASADLYIEIKAHGLSYIILSGNACVALATYYFKPGNTDEVTVDFIHKIIGDQPVLQQNFRKVAVIYGYAQTILVPQEFMAADNNREMMELVFGDTSDTVINTDHLTQQSMHNVYSVPLMIHTALLRYFPEASFSHLFSLLPQVSKKATNYMYCIFNTGQLTILLQKEESLQVIQDFSYKTPDDAAYHLLNVCKSFNADVQNITVYLSGMIDADSALYNEVYKYFPDLSFDTLPDEYGYPEKIHEYPTHYFSHLFAIASCV